MSRRADRQRSFGSESRTEPLSPMLSGQAMEPKLFAALLLFLLSLLLGLLLLSNMAEPTPVPTPTPTPAWTPGPELWARVEAMERQVDGLTGTVRELLAVLADFAGPEIQQLLHQLD